MRFGLRPQRRSQSDGGLRAFQFVWVWRNERGVDFQALGGEIASVLFSGKEIYVKIIFCTKQVPPKDSHLSLGGICISVADIGVEMTDADSVALEEALRLKEKHGRQ